MYSYTTNFFKKGILPYTAPHLDMSRLWKCDYPMSSNKWTLRACIELLAQNPSLHIHSWLKTSTPLSGKIVLFYWACSFQRHTWNGEGGRGYLPRQPDQPHQSGNQWADRCRSQITLTLKILSLSAKKECYSHNTMSFLYKYTGFHMATKTKHLLVY